MNAYCIASGQLVSGGKSTIFLSPSTSVYTSVQVCSTLYIMTEALDDKYLGLPVTVGLGKTNCFQYLADRLIMKMNGWKEKYLPSFICNVHLENS